jgi:hypothetical protein
MTREPACASTGRVFRPRRRHQRRSWLRLSARGFRARAGRARRRTTPARARDTRGGDHEPVRHRPRPVHGAGFSRADRLDEEAHWRPAWRTLWQAFTTARIIRPRHRRLPQRMCDCRKPAPGLLLKAAESFAGSASSVMFGDRSTDLQAARAAGIAPPRLLSTNGSGRPGDASEPWSRHPPLTMRVSMKQ